MPLPSEEVLPAGFALGAYRIERCIGAGGMGIVYEAVHQALMKPVAVKVLRRDAAADAEYRQRFLHEGTTASQLRHAHVVDVTDVGQVGEHAFLVMELLEGESLRSLLRREAPLPPERIADTFVPIIAALAEAHALGIVHRDVKPDNIFLTKGDTGRIHPKVLDFGISKIVDDSSLESLTGANIFIGTPHYASPEHLQASKALTGASDQYSLAVVMYEAAVGKNPFDDCDSLICILSAIAAGRFPLPRELGVEVEPRLEAIFLRGMGYTPADRFESMFRMGQDLLELAGDETKAAWGQYFTGGEAVRSSLPRLTPPAPVALGPTVADTIEAIHSAPTRVERGSRSTPPTQPPTHKRAKTQLWAVAGILAAGAVGMGLGLWAFVFHDGQAPAAVLAPEAVPAPVEHRDPAAVPAGGAATEDPLADDGAVAQTATSSVDPERAMDGDPSTGHDPELGGGRGEPGTGRASASDAGVKAAKATASPTKLTRINRTRPKARLALVAFLSGHYFAFRQGGLRYLRTYLEPHWILLPFNVVGELSRTLALSLRLFGNMLSGQLIGAIVVYLAGVLLPIPLMLLSVLTSAVQAYIFGTLTLVFAASSMQVNRRSTAAGGESST